MRMGLFARGCGLAICLLSSAAFSEWNFGWEGDGQGQWSGSDPQEFIVGQKPCLFRVRGRSGIWSEFSGEMPPGKVVVGVVNPREPDIIFFQLKKSSPFLFAGKRTCFQGESPYVEDPVEAQKNKQLSYPLLFAAYTYLRDSDKVTATETVTGIVNIFTLAGGYEWVKGFYRLYVGAGFGYGNFASSSSSTGPNTDYDSQRVFHFPGVIGGFYDLPETPYGAGLEFGLGYTISRVDPLGDTLDATSAGNFWWSFSLVWRAYYENWTFAPKFGVFDGFDTKLLEFQISYLFQ